MFKTTATNTLKEDKSVEIITNQTLLAIVDCHLD